jgi:poly(3-hydroxybutyrate) depolymerase
LAAALLSFALPDLSAQAQRPLPTGQVIEQVVCQSDAKQSYALYLPSRYTAERKWPIIYGFDPGGRGLRPVELFKEAAERYGYIVVGSNNSRNGLGVSLSEIIQTLWADTHERFALNEKRVYAAGFSGGARVALSLARSISDQFAGVIACGAGSPSEVPLRKDLPFVIYGIAGYEDFNLPELKQLERALGGVGAVNRLVTFAGGHAWPPVAVATQAVEWLELQAMKSGRRQRDEALIDEWMNRNLAQARAAEAERHLLIALNHYEALAQDFQGLREVVAFANKAKELRASKEIKDSLNREKAAEGMQQQRTQEFFTLHARLKTAENLSLALGELKSLISDLRKKAAAKEESAERTAARRTLALFTVSLNEEAARLRALKQHAEVIINLTLTAEIRPDNPQVHFALARAYALSGNKKQAIEALKKAVELGLNGVEQITSNPDLEAIRNEAGYKQLIEGMSRKR